MDQSEQFESAPAAPQTQSEKIAHVSQLLRDQADPEPDKGGSDEDRAEAQSDAVRGDDSGPGTLDKPEPESATGVPDAPEADADSDTDSGDVVTLSNLAEHLGVEPAAVYDLQVPIGDGITATLGELKDEYKQYGPVKEATAKVQERESTLEKQLLATRAEMNRLMEIIPENMRADMVRAAQDMHKGWKDQQEQMVLESVPDWADADVRAKDRAGIVEMLGEYGFSESEATQTQDARTLRFIRDALRDRAQLSDMKAAAKQQPGKASPPGRTKTATKSKRALAQALSRAKADPTIQGKAAVVSQLIRNQ